MNARTAETAPRSRWAWLAAIAVVSAIAMAAVVAMQVLQLRRLGQEMATGSELRVTYLYRNEIEYLQLREEWQRALDAGRAPDLRALTLRYEIWVGRVALLRDNTAIRRRTLAESPALDDTIGRIDAFIAQGDALFARVREPGALRAELLRLHPQLIALGEPIHDLALEASHRATEEHTTRDLAIERHTRITLALTGVLALAALAFAALSVGQLRQLARRHDALQQLTGELRQARRAAEDSSMAKSRFMASMSHEIRTPFQGLLGMLALLRDTGLSARQVDYLRTATESANHLLKVLNDVVDISQLEAGRLQINPTSMSLRALLEDVDDLMRPEAAARGLELRLDADADMPDRVRLDGTRVKQVLFNLISNAIKFSDQGRVTLELRRPRSGEGAPPQLEFVVTDTGRGMDPERLARLFERFTRVDAPATEPRDGSGLGLEISRGLARLMGGDLTATSEPGRGSRFSLVLPLVAAAEALPVPPRPLPHEGETPLRLQVLVAEDHPINRQVVSGLLESMGHHARFVRGGREAVDAVQAQRFDLVLMDLHMPGLDGIEATRLIRALPDRAAATVPIVALTADAFTDTRDRCLVAGMNSFLGKPVGREQLATLLRQLFGAGAAAEPPVVLPPRFDGLQTEFAPLLDTATVARTVALLSRERYALVLAEFFDQARASVEKLRLALRDGQPQDLHAHAHATRGAALTLGLAALAATAQDLQQGAANLPAHEVARLVQRLEELLASTRAAVRQAGLLPDEPVSRAEQA